MFTRFTFPFVGSDAEHERRLAAFAGEAPQAQPEDIQQPETPDEAVADDPETPAEQVQDNTEQQLDGAPTDDPLELQITTEDGQTLDVRIDPSSQEGDQEESPPEPADIVEEVTEEPDQTTAEEPAEDAPAEPDETAAEDAPADDEASTETLVAGAPEEAEDVAETAENAEPTTRTEQLAQQITEDVDVLQDPESDNDTKMEALARIIVALVQLIQIAMGKASNELLKSGAQEEGAEQPTESTAEEQEVQDELTERGAETIEDRQEALGEMREEAQEKINENTEQIAEIDEQVDGLQDQKKDLDGQISDLENQITDAKQEGKDTETMETQLEGLRKQVAAIKETIDEHMARRQELVNENEDLQKKLETIDAEESKLETASKTIEQIEKALEKVVGANVKIEMDDGKTSLIVEGVSENTPESVKQFLIESDEDQNPENGFTLDLDEAKWLSEKPEVEQEEPAAEPEEPAEESPPEVEEPAEESPPEVEEPAEESPPEVEEPAEESPPEVEEPVIENTETFDEVSAEDVDQINTELGELDNIKGMIDIGDITDIQQNFEALNQRLADISAEKPYTSSFMESAVQGKIAELGLADTVTYEDGKLSFTPPVESAEPTEEAEESPPEVEEDAGESPPEVEEQPEASPEKTPDQQLVEDFNRLKQDLASTVDTSDGGSSALFAMKDLVDAYAQEQGSDVADVVHNLLREQGQFSAVEGASGVQYALEYDGDRFTILPETSQTA